MTRTSKTLKPAAHHVRNFERVREAHSSEIAEDYVELIADLQDNLGEARAVDLANRLGVTAATVNGALKRLVRDGLVRTEPYRSVFLTEAGRDLAEQCRARHQLVHSFLVALGVDPVIAESDAEGLEHHVSTETLAAFERYLEHNRRGGSGIA